MTTFSLDSDPQTSPAMEAAARAQASRRGFTLVEIMAATGIMIAVILLVLSLTTNVLNTWNLSSDQLAQNYEARIALDFLAQDLEASVFRSNGMAWMEVRYEDVDANATDQTQLFFFSPVVDRPRIGPGGSIAGDICAVAYLTAFQNPFTGGDDATPGGDRPQYGLYRAVVDAENTFEEALSLKGYDGGQNSLLYSVWNGGALASDETTGITLNPIEEDKSRLDGRVSAMTWITESANYLSANVTNFQVIFYYQTTTAGGVNVIEALTDNGESTGTPIDFLVADGIYEGTNGGGGNYAAIPIDGHLVYADIKMTVLGDEGANMVANGTWRDAGLNWEKFQLAYGQTFTRRVYIMSNPI
jgi:type II secretory pathway pseudopilin PulG